MNGWGRAFRRGPLGDPDTVRSERVGITSPRTAVEARRRR